MKNIHKQKQYIRFLKNIFIDNNIINSNSPNSLIVFQGKQLECIGLMMNDGRFIFK